MVRSGIAHALYDIDASVKKGTKVFMVDLERLKAIALLKYTLSVAGALTMREFREIGERHW
jgi:hypothetical protein